MVIWVCLATGLLLRAITIVERVLRLRGITIVERFILRLAVDDTLRGTHDALTDLSHLSMACSEIAAGIHHMQENTAAMMLML